MQLPLVHTVLERLKNMSESILTRLFSILYHITKSALTRLELALGIRPIYVH